VVVSEVRGKILGFLLSNLELLSKQRKWLTPLR